MNADLFVIFGEPDITLLPAEGGRVRVRVNGVDVFDPSKGEVRSDGPDGIACWFIDTEPIDSAEDPSPCRSGDNPHEYWRVTACTGCHRFLHEKAGSGPLRWPT